jgi:hypothetical protein
MIELLFILGFSLHNIEEAIWLPQWSKNTKKFHKEVSANEFRFAVIIITAIGYLITFQYFLFAHEVSISKYIFLGFVLTMMINVIFPHIISSVVTKKYAPGTLTGVLLIWPVGIYILYAEIANAIELLYVFLTSIIITVIFLYMIRQLFKIGRKLSA